MLRYVLVLLLLVAWRAQAEPYVIDKYGATVNMPDGEGWFRRGGPTLPSGEFAAFAINSSTKAFFGVAVIPGFPTNDLRHASVLSRIMDTMRVLGVEPARQRFDDQTSPPYVEVIGTSKLESGESVVCVARGILRNSFLFIAFHTRPGVDADADQPAFMSNIETLRFDAPLEYVNFDISTTIPKLIPWHYRAYRGGAAMAVLLALAFGVMMLISRRKRTH
jgi:hypothetical protein